MALDGHLDNFSLGLVTIKANNAIGGMVGTLSTYSLGKERELEIEFSHMANDVISYSYIMRPQ